MPRENDDSADGTPLPHLDLLERVALVVGPALLAGIGLAAVRETGGLWIGLAGGVVVGLRLSSVRRRYRAVRTADGIERRRRPPEDHWMVRVAGMEYDDRWDRVILAAATAVGVGAFVALPFVERGSWLQLRLVMVGLGGLVVAAMTYGFLSVDGGEA